MRSRIDVAFSIGTLVTLLIASCDAQDTSEFACEACIELLPIVDLSFDGAPFLPTGAQALAANDGLSRFAFVSAEAPSEVAVFDAIGRFLAVVGGRGQGPQEFGIISAVAYAAADTLWVFDSGLRKINIYSEDLTYVRTIPLDVSPQQVMRRNDGSFVMTVRGAPGYRAAILSPNGSTQYLAPPPPDLSRRDASLPHPLAADGADRFWIVGFHSYNVERWDIHQRKVSSHEKAPEWFTASFPADVLKRYEGMIDTQSAILSAAYDPEHNHLWVIGGAPARDGRATATPIGHDMRPAEAAAATRGLIDHVIEVMDAATTEALATRRFDYLPLKFSGSLGFYVDMDRDSIPVVRVVRPVLKSDQR